MLLQDHCEAVANASTREEFQAALVRFAHDLGFEFMAASAVYDRPHAHAKFVSVHNAPASYLPLFDAQVGQFDPVMQHCKHSGLPIAWDQSTYVRAGHGEKWEEMAPHGYQTGISMALHLPQGRHFVFGVDGDRRLPKQQKELARMEADLVSVLMYAQDAAFCFLPPVEGVLTDLQKQPSMAELLSGPSVAKLNERVASHRLVVPTWLRMGDDPLGLYRTNGVSNFKARLLRLIH
jgi:Autoinducer binding domain